MSDMERQLEAILFVADEPLPSIFLAQALETDTRTADEALESLQRKLLDQDRGIVLRNVAGGWRLFTDPSVRDAVERFVLASRHARLTKASLETLAIVAYKQPVTRHQIAAIRGVNSDGVLKSLGDRGLLTEVGREDVPGRPVLYGTTPEFLERLGLPSLSALPSLAPLLDAVDEESGDLVPGDVSDAIDGIDMAKDDIVAQASDDEDASGDASDVAQDLADAEDAGDLG